MLWSTEATMAEQGKTSPWVWVGCGCLGALGLIVAVVAGGVFMAYRWGKGIEQTLKDPVARTETVKEILGSDELPEGYHAAIGFSVPLFAEIAMLSTKELQPGQPHDDLGERGFVYLKLKWPMPDKEQELRDFMQGKSEESPDIFVQSNIRIDSDEVIARGEMKLDGADVHYAVNRGDLDVDGNQAEGLATMMMIDCTEDSRIRVGILFGPDPAEGGPVENVDLTGSPADESALLGFLSHFDLCRR
jgi:hypothetical protein